MSISEKIALWSMIGAWVSAFASVVTVIITGFAAIIAFRTLNSWKDKERIMQLVRLKRAIFAYRMKVENISIFNMDGNKLSKYMDEVMQPALGDIFHELELAGFNDVKYNEVKLFNELFTAHNMYKKSHLDWHGLLDRTVELQKSIKVTL
ncbi:hypothetical protein ACYUOO_004432 [Klebsiella aerogenes]